MDESGQIDLATASPFSVGSITVDPAAHRISSGTAPPQTLEPRVMQVLVVLARANGAVVSRDALVRRCWEGRIVGDDSINRVISRLRRLSVDCDGGFSIETVTRTGYRLVGTVAPIASVIATSSASEPTHAPSHTAQPRRPRWLAPAVAIAVALAVILAWQIRRVGPATARPVIEVEAFTPSAGVAPALVTALRAETADFLANEKFYAVSMSGVPHTAADWRVSGTIAPADDGHVVVFARLFRAGSDAAVAQLRIDRDAHQSMLARSLGLRIGRTAGCILLGVTNPELTGGFVEAALPAFAASCITWHDKTSSMALRIERFRDDAAALPRSAYFRARLGEMLGDLAADGAPNAASLRIEGTAYVAAAEHIDPGQPHIFLARARLLPAFAFTAREAMLQKALAARPSDCACEFGDYSTFLSMVGRNAEARIYAARAREKEPKNVPWLRRAGEAAAVAGQYDTARSELAEVAGLLPDPSNLDDWRMNLGIWSKDWALANAMVARQPNPDLRTLQTALVSALAAGDSGRINAAGQAFLGLAQSPAMNNRAVVTALGVSGQDEAAAAAANFLDRHPLNLSLLFEPSFAHARQTPAFTALVARVGLVSYWRQSRHKPDFCKLADAAPVCATI